MCENPVAVICELLSYPAVLGAGGRESTHCPSRVKSPSRVTTLNSKLSNKQALKVLILKRSLHVK